MVWAKLDDAILDNPKIADAGVIGFALHVAGITWCCRNVLTNKRDGFVPYSVARRLLNVSDILHEFLSYVDGPKAAVDGVLDAAHELPEVFGNDVADHLVECALWIEVEGGYLIHDYDKYNPTRAEAEELLRQRSEGGKKGAAKRWGRRKENGSTHGSSHGLTHGSTYGLSMAKVCPDPDPDPDPREGNPPTPLRIESEIEPERASGVQPKAALARAALNATDDGAGGLAVSAWQDGVREATGRPCVLGRGPTLALVDAIVAHFQDPAGRVPAVRAKALSWAKQCAAKGQSLNPHRFIDWLNSGEPDPTNARKPWEPPPAPPPRELSDDDIEAEFQAASKALQTGQAVLAAAGGKRT